MEQGKSEDSRQTDFECKKVSPGVKISTAQSPDPVQSSAVVAKWNLEVEITTQTPQKTDKSLYSKLEDDEVKLSQKYETIVDFFDGMTCSLRLLGLCKKSPTFQNICTQVEVLTKRKFSYVDLAQIKYILPEVIQIDKILIHDQKTLCMKPDMKITLLFDVIEGHCEHSDFMAMHQLFIDRLQSFSSAHPEDCDIPQAKLPEPFSQRSQTTFEDKTPDLLETILPESFNERSQIIDPEQSSLESLVESVSTSIGTQILPESSLLPPYFTRCFSKKAVVAETEKTQPLASPVCLSFTSSDYLNNEDSKIEQPEECPDKCSEFPITNPPVQLIASEDSINSSACESPLQKVASSSDNLILETPSQLIPRRSMPSCDDKLKIIASQSRTYYKPAKRSLDFSHSEGDKNALNSISHGEIPETREPKSFREEGNTADSSAPSKKVEQSCGCPAKDCKTTGQSSLAMHQQMSACLPDLVALLYRIFQSVNHLPITKEELVHKIIFNKMDIVERREVEEQIELLEKLIPDWIWRKLAPSGDILYIIKKVSDLNSVQARVAHDKDCQFLSSY